MRKSLRCAAMVCACVAVGPATNALAATGGDPNAGDVWVDNVGQPPGPGHEMDPHLACQDINLWGSGLADTSGTFTIDGWPPSGSQEQDYASSWSYPHDPSRKSGSQVIAVINVQQLIQQAAANGDTPAQQGYHFKLQFSQDPQKHKTFWVNCPPPQAGSVPGTTSGGGSTTNTTNTNISSRTPSTSTSTSSTGSSTAAKHHKKKVKKHKVRKKVLHHPVRHHKAKRRSVAAFRAPTRFSG